MADFRMGGGMPSLISKSNRAGGGGVTGTDIGDILPGVLESLQESGAATITPKLYYPELLGQFNFPSYQRQFGTDNQQFQNIQRFGDTGEVWVPRDLFWDGPAMVELEVDIPQRFTGQISTKGYFGCNSVTSRPQIFYSWGAGFAAVKQAEFNMGGGMTYRLDRYGNFMGVMASCYTTQQRFGLMKASGSGVIRGQPALEGLFGLTGSCGEWISREGTNYSYTGAPYPPFTENVQVFPSRPPLLCRDRWCVPIKTPHTNFNNPRNPRKTIDTNITSEQFNIRIILGQPSEYVDSGVGVCPLPVSDGDVDRASFYGTVSDYTFGWLEHFRQYGNIFETFFPDAMKAWRITCDVARLTAPAAQNNQFLYDPGDVLNTLGQLFPTAVQLASAGNPKPFPLSNYDELNVQATLILSQLRLTNPLLGAYDVLKTRTDQAVYYPYQHLTTQSYHMDSHYFHQLSMLDYITGSYPYSDLATSDKTLMRQVINIPVNPLTAMYVMVFREKDRANSPGRPGGYSPSLFWQGLHLPRFALSYGAEKLQEQNSVASKMVNDLYNYCCPIAIPYMGGACTRSEFCSATALAKGGMLCAAGQGFRGVDDFACTGTDLLYTGVYRTSFMYEISLCERPPMATEEIFQQTPSFLGEQLNFDFLIDPVLLADHSSPEGYNAFADRSFLDVYPPTEKGANEMSCLYSKLFGDTHNIYLTSDYYDLGEKGYGPGREVNPWVLNNGPLMVQVTYAQNALWQMNPNFSKVVFARG